MNDIRPHGLHHVTAIASDPQRNVDFYTRVLGLRLVKQTVNFDAPDTYHLYYGNQQGHPSTLLTFFPWRGVPKGKQGMTMTTAPGATVAGGRGVGPLVRVPQPDSMDTVKAMTAVTARTRVRWLPAAGARITLLPSPLRHHRGRETTVYGSRVDRRYAGEMVRRHRGSGVFEQAFA